MFHCANKGWGKLQSSPILSIYETDKCRIVSRRQHNILCLLWQWLINITKYLPLSYSGTHCTKEINSYSRKMAGNVFWVNTERTLSLTFIFNSRSNIRLNSTLICKYNTTYLSISIWSTKQKFERQMLSGTWGFGLYWPTIIMKMYCNWTGRRCVLFTATRKQSKF